MTTGYEKSPDNGFENPRGRQRSFASVAVVLSLAVVFIWLARSAPPKRCRALGGNEIVYKTIDGKTKATLRLDRIAKGECVTIDVQATELARST